ncbi:MAG: hypothetical protein QW546_04430 [Candidatus Bathyarchaeia archaeon]
MPEKYITLKSEFGRIYVRADRLEDLRLIDAIIFDCDGVLIDIRGSYDAAISKTVAQLFLWLTGYRIPENLVSDEIIFLFRRSGGFNNDWDIVYGALMFLLCWMPENEREKLGGIIKMLVHERNAVKRLLAVREKTYAYIREFDDKSLEKLTSELKDFTSTLDVSGPLSVDRAIIGSGRVKRKFYALLRDFLIGSGRVGENIIATVFEEIFCGPTLFEEIYGIKPGIYLSRGMIENGVPIIKGETLSRLSSILGGARFGIASGSRFKSAGYVLRGILDWFNPKAQIFLDDVERAEDEYAKRGFRVNLKKPNPYSLLESARGLEPFNLALYVGDSIEDAIMVREAAKSDPRFIFAGVYAHTSVSEIVGEFLKFGCDLIIPSVNDIPAVIEAAKGGVRA